MTSSSAASIATGSGDQPEGGYDVAVIGAGVVGCAIARSLAVRGWRVVILEKGGDILEGASKGNSALLHTGYDEPEGSEELRILRHGFSLYLRLHERMNLPLVRTGAVVVAWTAAEADGLPAIRDLAHRNGTTDARVLERAELAEREPMLSSEAHGAVLIPGEGIVDPWSAPLAYMTQAVGHGARFVPLAEVRSVRRAGGEWRLASTAGTFAARVTVNAAGLFGDRVEQMRGADPGFAIRPRKGQFLVFDKPARRLVNSIILKVPNARTKGVLLAPTVFGNLLVGPTAEDQDDRHRAACDAGVLGSIRAEGERIVPALAGQTLTASFAALRPATEHRDYVLRVDPAGWVTVGGIRSTGLSAALGLGEWAAQQAGRLLGDPRPAPADDDLDWPRMPNLAEHLPRPYRQPGRGPILCHCECVTEAEVVAALSGPLAAGTPGGLKRRTRAMLGRCQGFGCMGELARLAPGLFGAGALGGAAR